MVFPDFQPTRVSEEPVCIYLFRQNPVLTSLHFRFPVRVIQPLVKSSNLSINIALTTESVIFYPPAVGGEQQQLVGLVPQDPQVVPRLEKVPSWRTLPQVNLSFFPFPSQGHIFLSG